MNRLLATMRGHAQAASQMRLSAKVGTVSGYDPNAYAVKVQFPPDTVESGWLPIASAFVGNQWGMYAAPTIGDQVIVVFQDSDLDAGVMVGSLYNIVEQPLSVPSGEFWLQHKNGAFFKLTNDGKAQFDDGHGARVVLNGDGTISSAGTWSHVGDVNIQGNTAFTGSVKANGHAIDDTHKHTSTQPGSGLSGVPQ